MLLVTAITTLAIVINVALHGTVLRQLLRFRNLLPIVLALIATHVVEIILFGAMHAFAEWVSGATLQGDFDGSMGDRFYFSAVTYTTVGFGDIVPGRGLRIFCACEALAGLILVGWSVSFTFLVMQARWGDDYEHLAHARRPSAL